MIATRIAELEKALALGPDAEHTVRLRRDLRYWALRRATARLSEPDPADPEAQFGSSVTYRTDEGELRTVILTGEDEADPAAGTVAYTAPVARALIGAAPGAIVSLHLRGRTVDLEVLAVEIPRD